MVTTLAKVFGVVFILIGILGFIPGITSDGHLLGIFEVDAVHNIIHLLTGIIAFAVASSVHGSRVFFKVFGIIYALVMILGFVTGDVLGLIHVNLADNVLHLIIAVVALWAGFMSGSDDSGMEQAQPMESQMPPMASDNMGGHMDGGASMTQSPEQAPESDMAMSADDDSQNPMV